MLEVFAEYLNLVDEADEAYRAASFVLPFNFVHGDAITLCDANGAPISVAEWGYLGEGKFQRRDFRLDVLAGMASLSTEASLFSQFGGCEMLTSIKVYPPMTMHDLAGFARSEDCSEARCGLT